MMNRPPFALSLLTILGLVLAGWMILYGLQMRFFATLMSLDGVLAFLTPPSMYITWVGWISSRISIADLGWPMLVVGCSLLGSIAGLWLRQSWAPRSLLIFSAVSLITFHWMNFLSILLLVLAGNKDIQQWMTPDSTIHG